MDLVVILVIAGAVLTVLAIALLVARPKGPPPPAQPPPAAPPAERPTKVEIERVPAAPAPEAPSEAPTEAPAAEAPPTPTAPEVEAPAPTPPGIQDQAVVAPPEAVAEAERRAAEAPPAPAPAPAVEEAPTTGASRLARGLHKTRGFFGQQLRLLSRRDRLDEETWDEVEELLIRADVGVNTTLGIVQRLKDAAITPEELQPRLKQELVTVLQKGHPRLRVLDGKTSVWLVTGVNGVGKTTSIAKLANRLRQDGISVVLAAADTFRAAAIDQLGTWADRVGVHMVRHAPGADPAAVVYDAIAHAKAKEVDVVIIDTAGRLHTKANLMEELRKVKRVAEREAGEVAEVLLVIDATVGQNGIAQAKTFQEAIDVTGVVLTKLDGTARGGIVVAVQEELGIPVKAVGVGETMDDLEPFDPESFVEALIEG